MVRILLACFFLLLSRQEMSADPPAPVPVAGMVHSPDDQCTRSVKVYIVTEAGIYGLGISITADTCQEALAGISGAIRGFLGAL